MQNSTYKMILDGEEYKTKSKFIGIFITICDHPLNKNIV